MVKPVYKIEVYDSVPALIHTITDEAISVYSKEVVTDGVGHFNFVVPTKKNGGYYYDDIALHDKVKIWFGYDSVGATPDFIGRVGAIGAPLSTASGYTRQISGLSQGEILLRRFKKNKFYTGTNASVIVTEWANDLSLGVGDITADANQPDIEVRTKTYFDLLRYISDYWLDGANQIKKDFYVDVDNDLVWKVRPFRTAGVETFTVGENIIHCVVTQKVEQVKNDIVVYGSADKPLPVDKDGYTNAITNWTASAGNVSAETNGTLGPKVGTHYISGAITTGNTTATFKRDIPRVTIRNINRLLFWAAVIARVPTAKKVRLHAPDNTNYFETDVSTAGPWTFNDLSLGPDQVYHATENPNGIWTEIGSPNWWDIKYIEFHATWIANGPAEFAVDGLWFYPDRWSSSASNAASQTSYGQRDLEITDDKLHSDSDCQKRAETILYQRKDPPTQIDLTVPGNTNVLVGDRLSMTIPAEGISAVNFDVLSVEHSFSKQSFITKATMVNSANIREPIDTSPLRALIHTRRRVAELTMDEKGIR